MGVGKSGVVVRGVRVTALEDGVDIALDIGVNVSANAHMVFAEARGKIMIYKCSCTPVNGKYRCELIKDWGVWENYQLLPIYECYDNSICNTLHVVLPNNIVNKLLTKISGYVIGIKVVTDINVYMLYRDKTWNKIHVKRKKKVLVTEKAMRKNTHG
jgi:hypothetical protein